MAQSTRPSSIGYLPTRWGSAGVAERRQIVHLADEVGLDHVALGDHVSFYGGVGFDGLVGTATILALSDRLATNTGVYLLPLRHPVLVARQLADIAGAAPGRFVFGVGIGGELPHEVEVCGVDPRTRGRRMDESMELVRALLTGEPVDFAGEFFDLEKAQITPPPGQPVPLVVGGRSEAAMRRAGRLGDGWFGIWVSARRYGQVVDEISTTADAAGRTVERWTHALNVWCGVGATGDEARAHITTAMQDFYQLPYDRFERWSPAGSPEAITAFLVPYAEAGCSVFNLIVQGASAEAEINAAGEIRRLMREATT